MLDRLEQLCIEEQANTHNIKSKLKEILEETKLDFKKYLRLHSDVQEYLEGSYDKEKYLRVKHLKDVLDVTDIVKAIVLSVAYAKDWEPIQAIMATLGNELCYADALEGAETALELLVAGVDCDLYDINSIPKATTLRRNFRIPRSLEQQLEYAIYPLPMICEPNEVKGNIDTSHLLSRGSLILGKLNHHDKPVCVDAINIANKVPLSLDLDIVEYDETPNKPLDTRDKREQFEKMAKDSEKVYEKLLELGNKFYLTWRFDKRGRMYSQGYHVNIQSTDYKKALISLSKQEVIEL